MLQKCPIDAFLRIIGQRWNSYILHILYVHGPLRFGVLRRQIPAISQKVLTQKLRELERVGIIHREQKETVPPEVTYSLTKLGASLKPLLQTVSKIANEWRSQGKI